MNIQTFCGIHCGISLYVCCIICGQRIYQTAIPNWLCQYLPFSINSLYFLNIFLNRIPKFGVTPNCLYRDLLTQNFDKKWKTSMPLFCTCGFDYGPIKFYEHWDCQCLLGQTVFPTNFSKLLRTFFMAINPPNVEIKRD